MATLTFSIAAQSKSYTVSAGDVSRITAALKARYERGRPGVTLTNAQVFDIWSAEVMGALKDVVKAEEGEAAAKAARDAVTEVVAA